MIWNRKKRKALQFSHRRALEGAREIYELYSHESTVISTGEGPGYSFISAAGPGRIAWESYFDSMRAQGYSAWDTKKQFDRELKRWEDRSL